MGPLNFDRKSPVTKKIEGKFTDKDGLLSSRGRGNREVCVYIYWGEEIIWASNY